MSKSLHHFFVYIPEEECYGVTESLGAWASLVKYNKDGFEYKIVVLNEELIFLEDITIGLQEEEI